MDLRHLLYYSYFQIIGEPALVIGYGPHNGGTSLNKANQRVHPTEFCSDKYSPEDASTEDGTKINRDLPNGFDESLICSGKSLVKENYALFVGSVGD